MAQQPTCRLVPGYWLDMRVLIAQSVEHRLSLGKQIPALSGEQLSCHRDFPHD
jgi:hypothetical protein